MSGTPLDKFGRQSRRDFGQEIGAVEGLRRREFGRQRLADEQHEVVFGLRQLALVGQHVDLRGLHLAFRRPQVQFGAGSGLEGGLVEIVGFLDGFQGLLRQLKLFLGLAQGEVFGCDFRHQCDLRVAFGFGGGEIFLQGLGVEAADMAEKVQFISRRAEAGAPLITVMPAAWERVKPPVPFTVGKDAERVTRYCARLCSTSSIATRRSRLLVSATSISFLRRSFGEEGLPGDVSDVGFIGLAGARILRRDGRGRAFVFWNHCAAGQNQSRAENGNEMSRCHGGSFCSHHVLQG